MIGWGLPAPVTCDHLCARVIGRFFFFLALLLFFSTRKITEYFSGITPAEERWNRGRRDGQGVTDAGLGDEVDRALVSIGRTRGRWTTRTH
jgi:hypothetical protein